ncbi:MAG: hypothetical protein PF589_07160, partial [Gammaproteobacteria bacterium]|nr:hypothetical protein [Gammaproteobacteria bacterium]
LYKLNKIINRLSWAKVMMKVKFVNMLSGIFIIVLLAVYVFAVNIFSAEMIVLGIGIYLQYKIRDNKPLRLLVVVLTALLLSYMLAEYPHEFHSGGGDDPDVPYKIMP